MKRLALALAFVAALISSAAAQPTLTNLPSNTVVGRLGSGTAGPAQAIPFATLATQLLGAPFTISVSNIGTTTTDALILTNPTAATPSQVQWSPRIHWIGEQYNATSAASQTAEWIAEIQPNNNVVSSSLINPLVFSARTSSGTVIPTTAFQVNGNGTSQLSILSSSGNNANLVYVDGTNRVWYVQNQGGSSDTLGFLNSDANGNLTRMTLSQAGTLTLTPATTSANQGINITNVGPTASVAGPINYNLITGTLQGTTTGSGSDNFGLLNTNTAVIRVNTTVNAATVGQGAEGGIFATAVTGTATASMPDVTSLVGSVFTNIDTTVSGSGLFGVIGYSSIGASGKASQLVGVEAESVIATGGSAPIRSGFRAVSGGNVQASTLDVALSVGAISGSPAYKKLIALTTSGSSFSSTALDTGGDFFFSESAQTVANFANLGNITVTGNILAFPQMSIAGSGLVTLLGSNIGSTSTDRLILENLTAAAAGAQQWSPRIHLVGQGWKTNATAASQTVDAIIELQTVQDTSQARGDLVFSLQSNAGGYQAVQSISFPANGNTATNLIAASGKNTNLVWLDGANKVWYLQNQGGSSDTLALLNSDANSNTARLSIAQTGSVTVFGSGLSNDFVVSDTGGNGANFKLIGNGLTPTKTIRANSGAFQVLNDAYSAAILQILDSGVTTLGNGTTPINTTVLISQNATAVSGSLGSGNNSMLQITGANATTTQFAMNAFGTSVYPIIVGTAARGTAASPTAIVASDTSFNFNGYGYDGTNYDLLAAITTIVTAVTANTNISGAIRFLGTNANPPANSGLHAAWVTPNGGLMLQDIINWSATNDPGTGSLYVDQSVIFGNLATDSTLTASRTLCQSTSGGVVNKIYFGSGTAGVCKGTSGRQFKQGIEPIPYGLAQLAQIPVDTFWFKPGYGDSGDHQQVGFIAQDVAPIMPLLVSTDPNGEPAALDYMGFVPVLVRAVQQLKVSDDNRDERIAHLEADNDNLRARLVRLEAAGSPK